MSNTTAKRGAGTKFLALLASLTMMIAGLVGVALSAPASAATTDYKSACEAKGFTWDGDAGVCYRSEGQTGSPNLWCSDLGLEEVAGNVAYEGSSGTWTSEANVSTVIVKAATGNKLITPSNPNGGSYSTSGMLNNGGEQPAISHVVLCGDDTPQPKERTVYWCDGEGAQVSTDDFKTWEWKKGSATSDEWVTEDKKDTLECDVTPKERTVYWCDGEGTQVSTDDFKTWEWKKGSATSDEWVTEDKKDTLECDVTPTTRTIVNCAAQTQTQTQNQDGSWPTIPAGFALTRGELVCGTTITEEPPAPPVTPPVVQEAQVVAAPAPATVAAPAPATVAVPAAATLPAAVPAGEGSSNGLPMWALAMVAMGMIGAAFAGKQLLGARK